jgi:hypothetical protein
VDSCTYELSRKKLIKGDKRLAGKSTYILRVEILKIEGEKVFVRCSSNFSDLIQETMMRKIE